MRSLQEVLAAGDFAVTAEVAPPLAAAAEPLLERAAPLRGLADAVNVTDAAGARVSMSSAAAAAILAADGFDPVLQMTCRDRNRIAIAGDLIGAAAQGVHNLLALSGDDPKVGDSPEAIAVHDLNSRQIVTLARDMRDDGALPSGRAIKSPPRFFLGVADSPIDPPAGWRPDGLLAKAEAGADFVQTQFCFDVALARRYMAALADFGLTEKLYFLLGIGPIASARSARWMTENLYGVDVPEAITARLEGAADPAEEGRRVCVETIEELRAIPGVAGVHLMAPNQDIAGIAAVIADSGVRDGRLSR